MGLKPLSWARWAGPGRASARQYGWFLASSAFRRDHPVKPLAKQVHVYPDDCVARPAHHVATSAQDKLAVLAVAAGIDPAAIGAVVEAAPARSHVRGRTAHTPVSALRAVPASALAAADTAKLQVAELAVRASATRSLAMLPARTHCAGPALLARPSRYTRCARRCPASPLPQRRTPPARQLQTSRCVPPADAVWRCFLRARTARAQLCLAEVHAICAVRAGARQVRYHSAGRHQRASRRPRGACLRHTQSGTASCVHALRGPSSAWQKFTLYALCAQVLGNSAAAAPDATYAPAAEVVVSATLASARPSQPFIRAHALHEPLSA